MRINKKRIFIIFFTSFFTTNMAFACITDTEFVKNNLEGKKYRNSEFRPNLNCTAEREITFGYMSKYKMSANYKMKCGDKVWSTAVIDFEIINYGFGLSYETIFLDGFDGFKNIKDNVNSGEVFCYPAGRIEYEGKMYSHS